MPRAREKTLGAKRRAPQAPKAATASGQDPRIQLNEWRQHKRIVNFGYELLERLGPAHQPSFVMTAWVELPGGEKHTTDRVEAGSKKEAQLTAAAALLALLQAQEG